MLRSAGHFFNTSTPLTDLGILAAYSSRRVLLAQWPMPSISSIVMLERGGVERGSLFREACTYPISSRTVGIVRCARWSFFFHLIVVALRKVVYILRRVSGLHSFPTVLPNISLIYRKLS